MNSANENNTRGAWIVGGATMIGTGVGFVLLAILNSALLLVASIIIGVGVGILLASRTTK